MVVIVTEIAETEGHRLFRARCKNQSALARDLDVSQQMLSKIACGHARPGAALRAKLAAALGIPETAWLTAEERGELRKLRKKAKRTVARAAS